MTKTEILKKRKQISGLLLKRRLELGISQDELGKRTGIPRTTIGKIERAEWSVGIDSIIKLCNALDLGIEISPEKS
jgi:transcriptional regulator with XRE-family HTH domain